MLYENHHSNDKRGALPQLLSNPNYFINECTKSANPRCLHGHVLSRKLFPACMNPSSCFWLYS